MTPAGAVYSEAVHSLQLWRPPNPVADFIDRYKDEIFWGGLVLGGLAAGGVAIAIARSRRPSGPGYPDAPPESRGAAFAQGDPRPTWPVGYTSHHSRLYEVPYKDIYGAWHGNMSRAFRAGRESRYHAGADLYANAGDPVVAPEDGTVVQIQTFFDGTDAMLIQGDYGVTVLLGEIKRGSSREFGITEGSRVVKGQTVARVGLATGGSHMLHFETYACCPATNSKWYKGHSLPSLLLDPTEYLLRARAATVQSA